MIRHSRTASLAAYECWLRGAQHRELESPDALADARRCYEAALELDPNYARAHAWLAEIAYMDTIFAGWGTDKADNFEQAYWRASRAVELDPTDARPHYVLGMILMARRDWDAAQRHLGLSAGLDPSDADAAMCRATALAYLGQPDEAYATAQVAMRLNPHHPDWYLSDLGVIRFAQRRYPECLECFGQIPETGPRAPAWKAAAAAHLGRDVEARKHAAAFLANAGKAWAGKANAGPRDYVRWFVRHVPLRLAADQDRLLRGLRKAGLPA